MAIAYGTRINDDTNFITEIDLDNNTCETTGYIDGEAVDFSGGGGGSDLSPAQVTFTVVGDDVLEANALSVNCTDFETTEVLGLYKSEEGMFTEFDGSAIYAGNSETYDFLIAQGKSISAVIEGQHEPLSVTGNANVVQEEDMFIIHIAGDCTITAEGSR